VAGRSDKNLSRSESHVKKGRFSPLFLALEVCVYKNKIIQKISKFFRVYLLKSYVLLGDMSINILKIFKNLLIRFTGFNHEVTHFNNSLLALSGQNDLKTEL
jgi:hypothetical protein